MPLIPLYRGAIKRETHQRFSVNGGHQLARVVIQYKGAIIPKTATLHVTERFYSGYYPISKDNL
ncbi:hypothetical protein [Xenorhabdus beddingii]|uniref:hypothetical protein n=1 Tax=Xenorhabdus beddingii TaxID=40578 RepID=UPI001FCA1B9E|nr:hypothetical protein [Xenorhabdus beddingii]